MRSRKAHALFKGMALPGPDWCGPDVIEPTKPKRNGLAQEINWLCNMATWKSHEK